MTLFVVSDFVEETADMFVRSISVHFKENVEMKTILLRIYIMLLIEI